MPAASPTARPRWGLAGFNIISSGGEGGRGEASAEARHPDCAAALTHHQARCRQSPRRHDADVDAVAQVHDGIITPVNELPETVTAAAPPRFRIWLSLFSLNKPCNYRVTTYEKLTPLSISDCR